MTIQTSISVAPQPLEVPPVSLAEDSVGMFSILPAAVIIGATAFYIGRLAHIVLTDNGTNDKSEKKVETSEPKEMKSDLDQISEEIES